jgi:dTDP-glucose pyrophosphorylase
MTLKAPSLVVLAAGMGSRYGSLKQMDAFGPNGENIIDYSIYDAILAGYEKVVFVIRRQFEYAFKEFFSGKFEDQIAVEYVCQELDVLPVGYRIPEGREKPWGTGHAVWVTRDVIDGPFAVINADDYYGRDAYFKISEYFQTEDARRGNYCVVGYYLRNTLSEHGTVNRGVCHVSEDMHLHGVEEIVKIARESDGIIRYPGGGTLTDDTLVSMNIWGFLPSYFDYAEEQLRSFLDTIHQNPSAELYIPTVIDQLIVKNAIQVKVLPSESSWFGVTYKEDKPFVSQQITNLIKEGLYPAKLWK